MKTPRGITSESGAVVAEASLDGVRAKLQRADEHLETLAGEMAAFLNADPSPLGFTIPHFDPETKWHVVYAYVEEEPPDRLGVILGDVLHNIRSALDHLVWQLVILNGGTPKKGMGGNSFPIALTEAQWTKALKGPLLGVSEDHCAIIEKTQPYKQGDKAEQTYFGWLQFLSNTDKHQVVHPIVAILRDDPADKVSFHVTKGPGRVVRKQFRSDVFSHGTELLRCKVEPMTPDTEVEMVGDVPVYIAFSERPVPETLPKALLAAAQVVVRELEPAFPS
jgi:hypothetical protein